MPSNRPLPILDVTYRSRQLTFRRHQIAQWLSHEHAQLQDEVEFNKNQGEEIPDDYVPSRVADIEAEAARQEKDALAMYGMLEGSDPRIAPLRRALAVWGLTADDIGVLSIHGTSTNANVSGYRLLGKTQLITLTGGERDGYLERHPYHYFTYTWQCSASHSAKESTWPFQRRFGCMADGRSITVSDNRHCTGQSQQRVSILLSMRTSR